jgi:cellulose synthase/poly-beta-1,6-N-acetylglucosamine synthase-like glycosyltransferase
MDNANPAISVIIPTLNEERYLESTLKAVRCSDFAKSYEIIVSDGGSEDRTVEIAEKFADKVIVTEKGISKGRNAGAKEARGDILIFVDADTIVLFNTLTQIAKTFERAEVVLAGCPVLPLSPFGKDFLLYWSFNNFVKASLMAKKPNIAGLCFACRKKEFYDVGGFDENVQTLEDFDLSERLSAKGEVVFNEDTFVLTSPRRFTKWGSIKAVARTFESYVKYLITGNGVDIEKYEPVR